jgi:hypothetical protein
MAFAQQSRGWPDTGRFFAYMEKRKRREFRNFDGETAHCRCAAIHC